MWRERSIAVIVPAFNEERLVGRMLSRVPIYVDAIYVVDDASTDGTTAAAMAVGDPRIRCTSHRTNRGVGAAIASGYRQAYRDGFQVLVVMAADDQMHPDDLQALLEPVCSGAADYAKGNRFLHSDRRAMPLGRRIGGKALGWLTRTATGYRIDDSQCGYTALCAETARALPLEDLWPRYGYPNDLLGLLAMKASSVVDVPVRPIYAGEASGVRPWHVLVIGAVIARRWILSRPRKSSIE